MQASTQEFNELKLKFIDLDSNGDGFINLNQLQTFMQKENIKNVPKWKTMEAMTLNNNKMNQQNFIIWIMGCRIGLEDFAFTKFQISRTIEKMHSAGPSPVLPKIKKSSLKFEINKPIQTKDTNSQHFLKVDIGIDTKRQEEKVRQLTRILGRNPSDIYLLIKFRVQSKGQQIAQKLEEIIQFGVQLGSQFGPTVIPIIQSLNITSKQSQGFIYLIFELNNTFFNSILKYLEEALYELSPSCQILLQIKIASDFSKILQQNFDALNQFINFQALFQIDGVSLDKVKQKMVQQFDILSSDQKMNTMFMFLLQEVNLSSSFKNLKDCFQSFGVDESMIPKPYAYTQEIKNTHIKQLISQFIPDGDQFLTNLSENCFPEGQISINAKSLGFDVGFKLNVQGAFDLL